MKKITMISIFVPILIFIFYLGFITGDNDSFIIKNTNNFFTDNILDDNNSNPQIHNVNVNSLIDIHNEQDIILKRKNLIHFIWKKNTLPDNFPSLIENKINDTKYIDLQNLKQIDKFTIDMKHGLTSIVYFFTPVESNNKVMIFHEGHGGDFIDDKNSIQFFLKNGYSVLAFSMPLLGMNNQPTVDIPEFGQIKLISHKQFVLLESDEFSPISFFVEPITLSLNYLDENYNFDSYHITGISGGGWTTILYAAIDDRISQSFSVAGSLPLYLRFEEKNIGDYEQFIPELYEIANYLELYVLGSYGEERKLLQIFNKLDPCCFSGNLYELYTDDLKSKISILGKGTFDVYLDETQTKHEISNEVLNKILNSLEK